MLAVSSLGNTRDENKGEMVDNFSIGVDDFPDFGYGNLLDSIDFDELFVGINDGDVLPDLDMDTEILTEFSLSAGEDSDVNASVAAEKYVGDSNNDDEGKVSGSFSGLNSNSSSSGGEEIVSKRENGVELSKSSREVVQSKKFSQKSKNNSQGKRKVKVDWTPELHRRFVQAVEQLGVDKAVPSRILELMGIECLTRHNIASHLQKYRSHRKHLLAREAQAARWGQRRQMYAAGSGGGGGGKREMVSSWIVPTIGFPPITPPLHHHHFRPLHVWGHPTADQSPMHMWPKHLLPSFPPPPWPSSTSPPPTNTHYWHPHHRRVQNGVTSGPPPCFPPPMGTTRFPSPLVPGMPSPPLHKVDRHVNSLTASPPSPPHQPPFDFHPSKESVDAAIGDVLSKPWLPLPLGLKPPSLDGVMEELQRQGISKIPPTSSSA